MNKSRLSIIVFVEAILLTLVAVIAGAIAAFPVVLYFSVYPLRFTGEAAQAIIAMGIEPVMPTVVDCSIFCHQALIVGVLTLVSVSFPLLTIAKLKSIEAIRR
jgi:ABC-type lipoprotein release transport system permease subunit